MRAFAVASLAILLLASVEAKKKAKATTQAPINGTTEAPIIKALVNATTANATVIRARRDVATTDLPSFNSTEFAALDFTDASTTPADDSFSNSTANTTLSKRVRRAVAATSELPALVTDDATTPDAPLESNTTIAASIELLNATVTTPVANFTAASNFTQIRNRRQAPPANGTTTNGASGALFPASALAALAVASLVKAL